MRGGVEEKEKREVEGEGGYSPQVQRVLSRIYSECSAYDNGYDSNDLTSPDRNHRTGTSTGASLSPGPGPSPGPLSSVFERVVEYSPRLLRLTFEKKVALH